MQVWGLDWEDVDIIVFARTLLNIQILASPSSGKVDIRFMINAAHLAHHFHYFKKGGSSVNPRLDDYRTSESGRSLLLQLKVGYEERQNSQ